jgi:tetratricopeptide (TPR) repeat protein
MMTKNAGKPYPGARPFGLRDRELFFGRGAEAAILAEWWQNNALTVAVGTAGSGKTSLLQAGVLPLLADQKAHVLPVGSLSSGATFPFAALPAHNPYTLALLRSWSSGEVVTRLVGQTIREFVEPRAGDGVVLAAIDPADELLSDTGPRRSHRWRFLRELGEAVRAVPGLHVLLVARREGTSAAVEALGEGVKFDVMPLTRAAAVDALSMPSTLAGRPFAEDAAEKLIVDLQTSYVVSGAAPERGSTADWVEPALLQAVCTYLWDSMPADVELITTRHVRRYGDVDAALAVFCGTVIAEVAEEHELAPKRITSWLIDTLVTEFGTRGKAYEGGATTAGMSNAVVRALEDRHLLVAKPEVGLRWYTLLSDRLIEPLRNTTEVRLPPVKPDDYLRMAEQAVTAGELDLAQRFAEEILRTSGSPSRFRAAASSLLGNLAYDQYKHAEAEVRYREAARLYGAIGDRRVVAYQLAAVGQMLLAQGHVTEAVEEFRSAVGRLPNDLVLQTELAAALWEDGRGPAAVAILNDVLRMDGNNRAALRTRGEILAYLGEAQQAMHDLNRVTMQGQPSARAARGLALAELGDRGAAHREIEDAVAEGQHNGLVLLYAARAFALEGDDGAVQELARLAADATDPPLSPRHREIAQQLVDRGS